MISKIIESTFQEVLLEASDGFARWLYGSEAVIAVLLVVVTMTRSGIGPPHIIGIWYATWMITSYYDNRRKRHFKNCIDQERILKGIYWEPDADWYESAAWVPPKMALAVMAVRKALSIIIIGCISVFLMYEMNSGPSKYLLLVALFALIGVKVFTIFGVYKGEWPNS